MGGKGKGGARPARGKLVETSKHTLAQSRGLGRHRENTERKVLNQPRASSASRPAHTPVAQLRCAITRAAWTVLPLAAPRFCPTPPPPRPLLPPPRLACRVWRSASHARPPRPPLGLRTWLGSGFRFGFGLGTQYSGGVGVSTPPGLRTLQGRGSSRRASS